MGKSFPSTRLVLAAMLANFALGAFMLFGTLARLTDLAEGLEPFDLRPRGYSIGEARTLITMLGEEGRRYYIGIHQWAANAYPLTFLISHGLLFWWITANGRLRQRPIPFRWRCALLLLPTAEVVPDYVENIRIRDMIAAGPEVESSIVAEASMATQAKILLTGITEIVTVLLLVIVVVRWALLRRARAG